MFATGQEEIEWIKLIRHSRRLWHSKIDQTKCCTHLKEIHKKRNRMSLEICFVKILIFNCSIGDSCVFSLNDSVYCHLIDMQIATPLRRFIDFRLDLLIRIISFIIRTINRIYILMYSKICSSYAYGWRNVRNRKTYSNCQVGRDAKFTN